MTLNSPAVLIGFGGAVCALLRYTTTAVLDAESFPSGTMVMNVVGASP